MNKVIVNIIKAERISAKELCEKCNCLPEHIRRSVNSARQEGVPICSSREGYWFSNDKEEIKKTIGDLKRKISGMQKAISGLEKALKELS